MARYVNVIPTQKDPFALEGAASKFLCAEGFTYRKLKDGQMAWQKGNGWVAAPQFIRVSAESGAVRVEAWIKFAVLPFVYTGEMGLDGAMGFAMKAVLRERVRKLEALLGQ